MVPHSVRELEPMAAVVIPMGEVQLVEACFLLTERTAGLLVVFSQTNRHILHCAICGSGILHIDAVVIFHYILPL